MNYTKTKVASMIDHTALKAVTTLADVKKLCDEAKEHGFASVCVNPAYISFVANELKGSNVLTCSVIGFPLGANTPEIKAKETETAVSEGAQEVDMVINVGALKSGDMEAVLKDIKAVVDASGNAEVKVIIETCYLTDDEKVSVCKLAKQAGADFVKTSTGFGTGGATAEDVKLMKAAVEGTLKVKASGGIRTAEDANAMLEAGADRIGASAGIAIIEGFPAE
ncbi:MAG: deoxyribose-phosphate aldolase [Spirochaetia bacterium]